MSPERRGPRDVVRRPDERGSAVFAVLVVGLLVGAAGLGALVLGEARLRAARRRVATEQARLVARSAAGVIGSWFEARERGALVAPPAAADVDREARRIDDDGDGAGPAWAAAAAPWNVRYRDAAPGQLFRPPDAGPDGTFVGTPDGPDVALDGGGRGAAVLDALSRALEPRGTVRLVRATLFRAPAWSGADALATVEVRASSALAGGAPALTLARGEVRRVDWSRPDRPLVAADRAELVGDARWEHGEALVGGTLDADPGAWPGGVPWLAPDRPLRDDADGDGLADDVDGDGTPDLAAWRAAAGVVPDPWFRARIGGLLTGAPDPGVPCGAPFPFGPRRLPPAAPSRAADRSGLFVRCPAGRPVDAVPGAWVRLAARGPRGLARAVEDPARPGWFRLHASLAAEAPSALVARTGGVVVLVPDPARTAPLDVDLDGSGGGLVLVTGDLRVRGVATRPGAAAAPGDPRDAAGAERAPDPADDALDAEPWDAACAGWDVQAWWPVALRPSHARHACTATLRHWRGLLAAGGTLEGTGPLATEGQVRGRTVRLDGSAGTVRIAADPDGLDPAVRPGPPGAPRVVTTGLRTVP